MSASTLYEPLAKRAHRLGHRLVGGAMDQHTAFAICGCCAEICVSYASGPTTPSHSGLRDGNALPAQLTTGVAITSAAVDNRR